MTHSGVIGALHHYLVSEDPAILPPRKLRLKRFAAVFMHLTVGCVVYFMLHELINVCCLYFRLTIYGLLARMVVSQYTRLSFRRH